MFKSVISVPGNRSYVIYVDGDCKFDSLWLYDEQSAQRGGQQNFIKRADIVCAHSAGRFSEEQRILMNQKVVSKRYDLLRYFHEIKENEPVTYDEHLSLFEAMDEVVYNIIKDA